MLPFLNANCTCEISLYKLLFIIAIYNVIERFHMVPRETKDSSHSGHVSDVLNKRHNQNSLLREYANMAAMTSVEIALFHLQYICI